MVKFHTTYKWRTGQFKAAAKVFISLFDGTAPKIVQEAMQKFKNVQMWYAWTNNCFFAVYDLDENDISLVNVVGIYLADCWKLETTVVIDADANGKIWDELNILGSE